MKLEKPPCSKWVESYHYSCDRERESAKNAHEAVAQRADKSYIKVLKKAHKQAEVKDL